MSIDRIIRESVDDMFLVEAGLWDRMKNALGADGAKNIAYFAKKFGRTVKDLSLDKVGSAAAAGRIDAVAVGNNLKREFVRWSNGSGKPLDTDGLQHWMTLKFDDHLGGVLWSQVSPVILGGKTPPADSSKRTAEPEKTPAGSRPGASAAPSAAPSAPAPSNRPWAGVDNVKTIKPPVASSEAGKRIEIIKKNYEALFDRRQTEEQRHAARVNLTDAVRQLLNMVSNENLQGREYVGAFLASLRDARELPILRAIIPVRESPTSLKRVMEAAISSRDLDRWFHAIGEILIYMGRVSVERNTRGSRANQSNLAKNPDTESPPSSSEETKQKVDPRDKETVVTFHEHQPLQIALTESRLSEDEFTTMFVLANKAADFAAYEKTFANVPSEKLWAAVYATMRSNTNDPQHFDETSVVQKVRQAKIASADRYIAVIKNAKDSSDFHNFRAKLNDDPLMRQDSEASFFVLAQTARL